MSAVLPLRPIAQTGLQVSAIGLGTVKIGRNQGVKYPGGAFALPDDAAVNSLLDLASDLGVNLIDTAPAYGSSEERLGQLLGRRRERFVLSSKAGEEFQDGLSSFDFSPAHLRFSLERSLRRLRTTHLDVFIIHSDGLDEKRILHDEVLLTAAKFKQEGLVRAIGISTKTLSGGLLALEHGADLVMATVNTAYHDELPVLHSAKRLGRAVFIKKAFASGHLSRAIADPVLDSLSFLFGQPGVSSVITGTITPAHLRENVAKALHILHPSTHS